MSRLGAASPWCCSSARKACTAPGDVPALSDLGACLLGLDRLDEALQALTDAAAGDPGHAAAHGNLGAVYLRGGRLHLAEASTRRALDLDPEQHRWVSNLAVICKDLGRFDEA